MSSELHKKKWWGVLSFGITPRTWTRKTKEKMFPPDWTKAEKAPEERSVIRSNSSIQGKRGGAFLTSLGAKTNIILYKKNNWGWYKAFTDPNSPWPWGRGWGKQLRVATNFSSLGKEEKRSKWNSISQKLKPCACREQKKTRLME